MKKDKETIDDSATQDELREMDNLKDTLEDEDLKKID